MTTSVVHCLIVKLF